MELGVENYQSQPIDEMTTRQLKHELDKLQQIRYTDNPQATERYNDASNALVHGRANPEQSQLVGYAERIKEELGRRCEVGRAATASGLQDI